MPRSPVILILIAWSLGTDIAAGGVVIEEDFRDTKAPGWIFSRAEPGTGPYLTAAAGRDDAGNGALRLTDSLRNQSNSAFYEPALTLGVGSRLTVSFEFSSRAGTGADGIALVIVDASRGGSGVGGYGGSLGYAARSNRVGMPGGYLAVGFDELGNFSNPTEGRLGGPGGTPNAIAVRGAGDGRAGYAYLTGTPNLGEGAIDFPNATSRPDAERSRRAVVTFDHVNASELLVSVAIGFGTTAAPVTLIDRFNVVGRHAHGVQPMLPEWFRIGFTASTGALTNIHEIRDLLVTIEPSSAVPSISAVPEPSGAISILAGTCIGVIGRIARRGSKVAIA
ncbi:MAG: hypothetical protein SFX72_03115 [Isosphaeraceae bacterium]|nr:hypothetical protein [Isosphaeraceae bacterium]